ncbi:MAG: XRE family transcriptional regulator, partial [Anaerolineae bacterium]
MSENLTLKIRAKKLGVLLRDARLAAGKTMKEAAGAIGVSSHRIGLYERGEASPSLPELESLAFFFGVPLNHFWSDDVISDSDEYEAESITRTIEVRQRIIGVKLRSFRLAADIPLK